MIDDRESLGQGLTRLMAERGLSFRDLERRTQISKSKLNAMCRPGTQVRDEDAKALDEVLHSGITLAAAASRERVSATAAVLLGPRRFTELAVSIGAGFVTQGVSAVDRRQFLQMAGSLTPALFLEMSRHGMGEALAGRTDAGVPEWEEIVHEHGFAYMISPPQELLEDLVVDVLAIQFAVAGEAEGSRRARDLQRCGALLAALMAMTVANLGELQQGRRWWRTARELADKSQDAGVQAWVRGRQVVRALYEKRPAGWILDLVAGYEDMMSTAPHEALPEFLTGKAQLLAMVGRGDEARASLPYLLEVCEGLPEHVTRQGASVFGWSLDRQLFTQSFVHSFGGEYELAAAAQDAAVKQYPPSFRRGPAQIELQRALCLVRTGDSSSGVGHAHAVLEMLPPDDLIRPVVDLAHRVDAEVPISDSRRPGVADYREFLRSSRRQIEGTHA